MAIMPVSPPDSTLVRRTLAKWHYLLCCAPAYLAAHAAPRVPADLANHNCLIYAYSPFGSEYHFIDPAGDPVVVRVSGKMIASSLATTRGAAVAGLGVWASPAFLVPDLLASGALVPLLTNYRTPEMEVVALYPHRRQLSAKVRLFLDMLVARFAEELRSADAISDRAESPAGG